MIDYKKIISNRELRLKIVSLLRFIPDKLYLKIVFWIKTGKRLNLDNPITFCDKLNWLKLHNQHKKYTELVDKTKVGILVKEKLGEDISFPILGKWKHFDEIDFDKLPNSFVLKCNHDSGSVKIIRNKNNINKKFLKNFFESRLKMNSFVLGREYPYRNVEPYIYAEKLMTPVNSEDINDYKFFCFNGEPKIMFVATERSIDCKFDFFDMDFNHLNIENIHPQSGKYIEKPKKFEEMKIIASKLSQGMEFVRIDLYEINEKVYFGEYTFFHGGGFWPMNPYDWELKLGNWLDINI